MQNNAAEIQSAFLQTVRERLPANLSFADEIAEILQISKDSAYRRIRGETFLSIDEIHKLCDHYKVSLDRLLSPSGDTVSFHYQSVHSQLYNMEEWLGSILQNLEMIISLPEKELIYLAKDIPIFYYFKFKKLAAFKIYFWREVLLSDQAIPAFNSQKITKEILSIGERITSRYDALDSIEIWSEESATITLKQLEYCYECGYFTSHSEYLSLIQEFKLLLEIIKSYATAGVKDNGGKFTFYKNDIILADNTILFKMGERQVVYKTHNTVNVLRSSDKSICDDTSHYFEKMKSRSTLISTSGEKERNKLFNLYFKRINNLLSQEPQAEV
ncbi:MAG: helix-turn-helix domain-containing protein [Candidatus Cyclobacteriaceae bacterium M2_1C_046]